MIEINSFPAARKRLERYYAGPYADFGREPEKTYNLRSAGNDVLDSMEVLAMKQLRIERLADEMAKREAGNGLSQEEAIILAFLRSIPT